MALPQRQIFMRPTSYYTPIVPNLRCIRKIMPHHWVPYYVQCPECTMYKTHWVLSHSPLILMSPLQPLLMHSAHLKGSIVDLPTADHTRAPKFLTIMGTTR